MAKPRMVMVERDHLDVLIEAAEELIRRDDDATQGGPVDRWREQVREAVDTNRARLRIFGQ